ncbi:MAG: alkaline phosphatase family protein [Bdellovibrionota bacterium]
MKLNKKIFFVILLLLTPTNAFAYVGPGAGFAFIGSAFVFVIAIFLAILTLAFWPIQLIVRKISGKGIDKNARTRRVVLIGLDGLSPKLVEKYIEEGRLPNFKYLKEQGDYRRLGSTIPSISPVAWSTFQTGVNPGAHNIFDFLTRDKRYCLPELSSTKTETRFFKKFGFIKSSKATVKLLRKSKPFWTILGKKGIFANILRVPISYPPEKFDGNILSAMCVPDLKGTQGSFLAYTDDEKLLVRATGGTFIRVIENNGEVSSSVQGPNDPFKKNGTVLTLPFKVVIDNNNSNNNKDSNKVKSKNKNKNKGTLIIGKEKYDLEVGEYTPWIPLNFKSGRRVIQGISKFCLRSIKPFLLYQTPINISPEKPALPISHPVVFSSYLAKLQGLYGTLGLMEDTWGRNEKALDDETFLKQTYENHKEREEMFFNSLKNTPEGFCACVFDASDRIQHMFWRYLEKDHPSPCEDREKFENTIVEMYEKMDELIGKTLKKINKDDVLIIMSDHGFTSFRRGFNLNTWLVQNGYMVLKDPSKETDEYFLNVDWSKTKAFAVGMAGIFINRKGRETNGIVEDSELEDLKNEISKNLILLLDPKTGKRAIRRIFDAKKIYKGLYVDDAPDLIIGAEDTYRVSWGGVQGALEKEIFSDNTKAWSADHDVSPEIVEGVLFSNIKIKEEKVNIIDLAPSILKLFALNPPKYMEGKDIF